MKYTLEATIPTTQYGNIRPVFELDTLEEEGLALERLHALWGKYGEKPLNVATGQMEAFKRTLEKHLSFTGETIMYDDATHEYFAEDGTPLLSGSKYAQQFAKPFDTDAVSKAVSSKTGEPQDSILKKWDLTRDISSSYGTAVHDSVEFVLSGGEIEKIPTVLRDSVQKIVESVKAYNMVPLMEVLVSNVKEKMVGRIDCLLLDNKEKPSRFIILDYKTNRDLKKEKIVVYAKQLEFYRDILIAFGLSCDGMALIHDDGVTTKTIDLTNTTAVV